MKLFKKLFFSDSILNRFQDNVQTALNPLLQLPIVDGVLLEDISLTSGVDNAVPHKLLRKPRMWLLADQRNNATVWRVDWDETNIILTCDSACHIKLWVA